MRKFSFYRKSCRSCATGRTLFAAPIGKTGEQRAAKKEGVYTFSRKRREAAPVVPDMKTARLPEREGRRAAALYDLEVLPFS
jgi:hypothetical protein